MKKKSLTFFLLLSITLNAQWQQVGPYNSKTVQYLSGSDNFIFAGTYGWTGTNTHFTKDEGKNWSLFTLPSDVRTALQAGPNILLSSPNGFYKSTNDGVSWEIMPANIFGGVYDLIANKSYIAAASDYGIAISNDNGLNWKFSKETTYSMGRNCLAAKGSNIYVGTNNGIFLSKDDGSSWSNIGLNYGVKSIGVTSSKIFALVNMDLYYSADEGKTWKTVANNFIYPNNIVNSVKCINQTVIVATRGGIYLSKDNGNSWIQPFTLPCYTLLVRGSQIYAGTYYDGIFVSNNSGVNWTSINSPKEVFRAHSLTLINNNLFTATNRGVCKSTDYEKTWENISSIDIITNGTYSVDFFDNILYAGSYGKGIYYSKDNGATWALSNKGIENSQVNCFAYDKTNLYAGTKYGLFSSKIDEHYYRLLGSSTEFKKNIYSVVLDGSNLYVGTNDGLFVSLDNGTSWKLLGAGSTPSFEVYSIHKYGSTVFLGTSLGIYKLSDDRTNYILVNNSVAENKAIRSITDYESILYAGSLKGEILRSSDNGNSWVPLEAKISTDQLNQLVVMDSTILASAYNGIWKFSFKKAKEITDTIETKLELPSDYSLSQNYPNPFNPSTTIQYQIPVGEALSEAEVHVTLKVYDVLGREVATLVDEVKSPGTYEVKFDTRHASIKLSMTSGVYFYRLQCGNYSETKKLILMK